MWLAPLLALLVTLSAAAGAATSISSWTVLSLALVVLSLALVVSSPARKVLLLLGCALLVTAHAARARDLARAPPLAAWFAAYAPGDEGYRGSPAVLVEGALLRDAESSPAGGVRLLIDIARIHVAGTWLEAPGRVQAYVAGTLTAGATGLWTRGRRIRMPVSLRWPSISLNPGGPNPRLESVRRGYALAGAVKSAALVEIERGAWWDERAADVRKHVRRATRTLFAAPAPHTMAVVNAIVIGDRAGLDAETSRRLMAAGTYHVIAISGGNIAVLTLIVSLALRQMVRSRRTVSLVTLSTVLTYGWIVGGEPSVSRAVTAASLWLAADLANVAAVPAGVFGLAAIVILLTDPLMVLMPGAWLSFGATLGILVAAQPLAALLDPARSDGTSSRVRQILTGLFAATLAAEIILLPVAATVFSRVSFAGLVLNFIAIPAMSVVQIAGIVAIVLVDWWGAPAAAAAAVVRMSTAALLESTRLLDWMPWLSWRVPPSSMVWSLLFYAATAGALWWHRGRRARLACGATAIVTLVVIVTAPGASASRPPPGWLRVTMLDVGQGDSLIVQFPTGETLVMDAGGASETFDIGERVVTPALWALGVRRIDWLAFSHADLDHIGGVAAIADEFRPREIWEGVAVPRDTQRQMLLTQTAGRHPWRQLRLGDRLTVGDVTIDTLNPPEPDWERQRVRNDDSIVLRLRYGDLEMLLTGDITTAVERSLTLDDSGQRTVRILKAAHHGSRTSSAADVVERYRPWAAWFSAGRSNTFGHPAPDVVARFEHAGARIYRTDRDGALIVESDGREVRGETWTGRSWQVYVVPGPP